MSQLGVCEWRFWDSGWGIFPLFYCQGSFPSLCFWISSCGSYGLLQSCVICHFSPKTLPPQPTPAQAESLPLPSPDSAANSFWADCPWWLPAKQTPSLLLDYFWPLMLIPFSAMMPGPPCLLPVWLLSPALWYSGHLLTLDTVIGFLPQVSSTLQGALRAVTGSFLCPQEFPPPGDHILSELFTVTRLSWVTLHGIIHSFIELHKPLRHD